MFVSEFARIETVVSYFFQTLLNSKVHPQGIEREMFKVTTKTKRKK